MNISMNDEQLDQEMERLRMERLAAEQATQRVETRTRALVAELRGRGVVVRRVAAMLGISPARVSQIEHQAQ